MSTKERQFPLSLSSVVKSTQERELHKSKMDNQGVRTATPQTATRNVANFLTSHGKLQVNSRSIKTIDPSNNKSIAPSIPTSFSINTAPSIVMVSEKIRQAMVARVAAQGVKDKVVLSALEAIPRHLFIESGLSSQAYIDASLPIGHHQTISKPYIVARMSEILRNGRSLNKILEIGTGCGYQAAVLSLLAKEVYSIERIKALHELAKNNLRPMRIGNIRLHYGDGMLGLPQAAPFDGIILAAAGMEVPKALLQQLCIGGRLIAPVGGKNQVLELIERVAENEWTTSIMEDCHFVPLHQGVI